MEYNCQIKCSKETLWLQINVFCVSIIYLEIDIHDPKLENLKPIKETIKLISGDLILKKKGESMKLFSDFHF